VLLAYCTLTAFPLTSWSEGEYRIAGGDVIRIYVFQSENLTLDVRVSEDNTITYPLIGKLRVGGLTLTDAEQTLATALHSGGYVISPQVTITVVQVVGNQVAILGEVNKPGSYPLQTFNMRLSQVIAYAGGIGPNGSETVILKGIRDGRPIRRQIDVAALFGTNPDADALIAPGDSIYVARASVFYIYGEIEHPGSYPLRRNMTVLQAIAQGGGPTLRGTQRAIRLTRCDESGVAHELRPKLTDVVRADDVIRLKEGLF
jgi:polysaccharide export outer membrane protein